MSVLSLYTIETALLDLLTAREELMAQRGDPAEQQDWEDIDEQIAAVESALQEYVRAEIKKCDGIHWYLTAAKQTARDARAEARRMDERARRIEASADRLKAICCDVMRMAEVKRIDGTAGRYLLRKGNGALAPLVVQEDVLPAEYTDVTVRMPPKLLDRLAGWSGWVVIKKEPANDRIREALKSGPVPGASLGERGEHLEMK